MSPPGSERAPVRWSRRGLLRAAGASALSLWLPGRALAARTRPRALDLENLHNGEALSVVYFVDGDYLPGALARVDHLLRDYRTGEIHPIAPRLLDLLHDVHAASGSRVAYGVVSGYRSPATNEMLRAQGHAVARASLHLRGMAADVRLADVPTRVLRDIAVALRRGGVGYYPESDFVHLDVGRFRTW